MTTASIVTDPARVSASALGCAICLSVLLSASPARADPELIVTGFLGVMTNDSWEDTVQFWDTDYAESGLIGVAVGRDVAHRGRLSFGYEIQAVRHFGVQDHFEINAPLVVRYDRAGQRLPAISSLAFGLGLSWASEKPQVEIDNDGDTTRVLIYWMSEVGLDLSGTEMEGILRVHHRSDGYGVFPEDSGSNALAVGVRRRF